MVGLKKQSREKYSTKASPGKKKIYIYIHTPIQPIEGILKTEESCKRYRDLEACHKAQKQKERRWSLLGPQVAAPRPARANGLPCSGQAGARARPAGGGAARLPSAQRSSAAVVSAVQAATIQGNDYYIILKEYGLESAEAAPRHVLRGDRSPGRHGDAALRPCARGFRALGARGGAQRCAAASLPPLATSLEFPRAFASPFLLLFRLSPLYPRNTPPIQW